LIKFIIMRKRRHDLTQRQFRDYWVDRHSILERQVFARGQLKKIVTTFVTEVLAGEAPYDGMVELYYANIDDFKKEQRDTGDMMKADTENFCDPDYKIAFLTEEVLIAGDPALRSSVKLNVLTRRRKGMTQAQFRDYWVHQHSILEREVFARGQIKKILATFVADEVLGAAPCDGMVELYFNSLDDLYTEQKTTGSKMVDDEVNFCDLDSRVVLMTEEVIIAG
jgi:uncharacterized protein (TIGR02118 family)